MEDSSGTIHNIDQFIFTLEVTIPDQSPRRLQVQDRILAGLDPRNDLILVDSCVLAKHFLFRKKQNILTTHYLGPDSVSFLNGLPLEHDKLYMLENGDVLKVGKIQIKIRREKGSGKTSLISDITPLTEKTELPKKSKIISEVSRPNIQVQPQTRAQTQSQAKIEKSPLDLKPMILIPYKIYAFLADVALTYLLLGLIFPTAGLMNEVQRFLFPFSEFLSQSMLKHHPEIRVIQFLSLFEFFVGFHALMIAGGLILGRSPGSFLVGIHQKEKYNFLTVRFKACIYALINIVALPLLIFDVPVYRGKNLKELLTFSQRELIDSTQFRISRKSIVPLLFLGSLLSPFFLKAPYNLNLTREKSVRSKYIESHTYGVNSFSKEFGISLKSEVGQEYRLLPSFEINKLGVILYDLKTKQALLMKELGRTSNLFMFFKYRYTNPFSGFRIPEEMIENQFLKQTAVQSLELSLTQFFQGMENFGLFMANGFLFKDQFLNRMEENVMMNSFNEKNPTIKLSGNNSEKVFFFSRKEIIEFSLIAPKKTRLIDDFITTVLSSLRFDQSTDKFNLMDPQILEVLEAFERSNYQTILTYYIKEAKKAKELKNPDWQSFLKKNIEQTKRSLFLDSTRIGLTKNSEKSFDDIIKTL